MQAIIQRESGRPGEPSLILLNPNASDLLPLRKWPTDRYVDLARRLLERFTDVSIGMTGAPDEAGLDRPGCCAGRFSALFFFGRQDDVASTAGPLHLGRIADYQ